MIGMGVKASLVDERGRVTRFHNTIVADGLAHAYARIFGAGDPLSGDTVKLFAGDGTELGGLDDGYPKAGGTAGSPNVGYRATFVAPANYSFGTVQLRAGAKTIFSGSSWGVLTGLVAANRYRFDWAVEAHIEMLIPDFLPDLRDLDQPLARKMLEGQLTKAALQSGENWLVRRWAGLDNSQAGAWTVELWGPDRNNAEQLPPFEALQAGNTIKREGPLACVATIAGGKVNLTFTAPANTTDQGAFGYRYGVLKAGGRIVGLADLGPVYPNRVRPDPNISNDPVPTIVGTLYNQAP